MATIEFLTKRIEGAKKNVEKLDKKLARILQAKATNWEVNPYYYSDYDIRRTERELELASDSLNKYLAELEVAKEKAASRNVPAILEFLANWKERVYNSYKAGIEELAEREAELRALRHQKEHTVKFEDYKTYEEYQEAKKPYEERYEKANQALYEDKYGKYEKQYFTNRWGKQDYRSVKVGEGKYEWLREYYHTSVEEALQRLQKSLDAEADRKYDFIIERTNEIVTQITDASNLKVGAKGDLNGYIVGTAGTAKVTTIGAGGYNIQCFHFRTLIHRI